MSNYIPLIQSFVSIKIENNYFTLLSRLPNRIGIESMLANANKPSQRIVTEKSWKELFRDVVAEGSNK